MTDPILPPDLDPDSVRAYRDVIRMGMNVFGLKAEVLREVRDAAVDIRIPTLVVWGKQDRILPVKHAEVIREKIPHARVHILDECGHAPQIEKPEAFNALVADFMAAQETA